MGSDQLGIVFVGPGRVGLSLGYALTQAEAVSRLLYSGRQPEPPAHPLFIQGTAEYSYGLVSPPPGTDAVFLSVPDDAVYETAQGLASLGPAPPGCAAYHLSGSMSADVLAALHERGYSVGTMHPLQTLSNPVTGADLLTGAFFSISGEPKARTTAHRVLSALGSPWLEVPAVQRPLYDAAAVLGSSYLTLLVERTRDLLVRAGVEWQSADQAVRRLVEGALTSLETGGGRRAATGPIARGDLETVRLHMRSLDEDERTLYRALGTVALESDGAHLDDTVAQELRTLFEEGR